MVAVSLKKKKKKKFLFFFFFPTARSEVTTGNVKAQITGYAREGRHDLIVIGSRERHGMSILVNLTEDTVLHAAPCDVLAVRLPGSRAS